MADQYAAMLLSSVLACWVVVGRTVYSRQIDSSIPVVFHIYEQAVMEEPLGFLLLPCVPCSSYIPLVCPFCIFLSAYPLPHCAILPFSCHCSSFPCPSPCFPVMCGAHSLSFTPPSTHRHHPLFYIASAFLPLTLTYIIVFCFFCSLLSVHISLYPPLQEEVGAKGWMDAWMDG